MWSLNEALLIVRKTVSTIKNGEDLTIGDVKVSKREATIYISKFVTLNIDKHQLECTILEYMSDMRSNNIEYNLVDDVITVIPNIDVEELKKNIEDNIDMKFVLVNFKTTDVKKFYFIYKDGTLYINNVFGLVNTDIAVFELLKIINDEEYNRKSLINTYTVYDNLKIYLSTNISKMIMNFITTTVDIKE